jgi:hypothetical protein
LLTARTIEDLLALRDATTLVGHLRCSVACAVVALAACRSPDARSVSGGGPRATPIDGAIVGSARLPSRVLWSWTSEKGARRLADGGPLLRAELHAAPPDDAWYDVHVRESCDDEVASIFRAPRFSRVRWAWSNPWGAVDGVADEHYGDQLIRIELAPGAVVARLSARCGTTDPLLAVGAALDAGRPEWSFFRVDDGAEIARAEVLAHPSSIAAVLHVSPRLARAQCDGSDDCFFAFREIVVVNEAQVARWSLGTSEVTRGFDDARATIAALLARDLVPPTRDDEDEYQRALASRAWRAELPLEALSGEDRWMLTLPFPRARYRALPRLHALLRPHPQVTTIDVPAR